MLHGIPQKLCKFIISDWISSYPDVIAIVINLSLLQTTKYLEIL